MDAPAEVGALDITGAHLSPDGYLESERLDGGGRSERRLFDRYVFVDWSGSASPNRGKDSIWFANGTTDQTAPPENPRTREKATAELRKILVDAVDAEERVLIGFDFPYGYPAGFSAALQLDSSDAPSRATWSFLREFMHDGPGNVSCRFEDAAKLNRRIGSPPGPFWGRVPLPL